MQNNSINDFLNDLHIGNMLENIKNYFTSINKKKIQTFVLYFTFIFLGLGLARLVNSIFYYFLISNTNTVQAANIKLNTSNKKNIYANTNPLSALGGFFFKDIDIIETDQPTTQQHEEIIYMPLATLTGHSSFARVVIQILSKNDAPIKEYKIGDRLGIDIITWIARNYIWVRRNGQKVKINIDQKSSEVEIKPAATVASVNVASGNVIKKTLSRQEVNKNILGKPGAIYKGASFGPLVNKKGDIEGYKIYSVQSSHVFYKLGARPGDIIKKVNDFPLSDTERMFELWGTIKTAPQVKIEIERNKKTIIYDFQIQN